MDKKLVVPGEFLSDNVNLADEGTYVEEGRVFSSVFGVAELKNHIRVVPLAGKYIPRPGDMVIGVVTEVSFSNWIVDIRSPYEGLLHISEFPKRIESQAMSRYLTVGDAVIALVKDVDYSMKVELTLNDQRSRQIREGRIVEVTPSKVPRLIGRSGSMIAMLKNETNCNIFIGQNGRIWLTGKEKDMDIAAKAISMIETKSHVSGLTERIIRFIREEKGGKEKEESAEEESTEEKTIEEERVEEEHAEEENVQEEETSGGILDELLGDDR